MLQRQKVCFIVIVIQILVDVPKQVDPQDYVMIYAGGAISERSQRQAIVATSTTEAEVIAASGQPKEPYHSVASQHPTVNDETQYKLLGGSIIPKKDVKEFSQNGVLFDGDEEMTPIDVVVFATASVSSFHS
ncbi:dimethylaniline monooxygenase [Trichonephila clavipes]|nr:dimethylaniline monooxygenase [Trichonephila clavipes]